MSQVGRISGPLLKSNLERNGIDLKISNTSSSLPALKLDVTNNRIGIGTNSPISELQVPNGFNTTSLIATGTVNVADFTLSNQEINVNSGDIEIDSGSIIEASAIATDAIKIEENNIYGTTSNEPIELIPGETAYSEQQKIFADDRSNGDFFGRSVAISGDYAVVGASGDNFDGESDAGSAYVFKRTGSTWTQLQKLTASDFSSSANFGHDVAIDGNTIVIGAYFADDSLSQSSGAVYVFVRNGDTWTEQQKITGSDSDDGDRFGTSVAISGDTVVVGAPRYEESSENSIRNHGAVYVFTRSGSTWTEQTIIKPVVNRAEFIGNAVAISGNTIVIGHGSDDDNLSNAGAAYVYTGSGSNWTQQQKLTASDLSSFDTFGFSVDIDGDNIIVGAYLADGLSNDEGAAYIFTRSGSTWTEQQKIVGSDLNANSFFGSSVAIQGDTAIIGAYQVNKPDLPNLAGATFVFKRDSYNVWTQKQRLFASDPAKNSQFGESVAFDNGYFIVGAEQRTNNQGVAYIFLESTTKVDVQSDLDLDENLHATGNITFNGDITFGSGAEDDITFAADIESNLIPDADNTYKFGVKDDNDSTYQRYSDLHALTLDTTHVETRNLVINGTNYSTPTGNSFYVDINGDDTNPGDNPQGAFRTLKHALSVVDSSASGPTTIHVLAGEYQEEFPLTVPANTNIAGVGFREVEIKPTEATKSKDCFLLTGETTVGNITISDFFYDSGNDVGYAFRFANDAITTSRSPYIQNVSVITKGSVTSASDPRGFDQGDAGRGALVDGSVLNANSVQASMLFHSVTFLTAGQIGLRMKDGVRVEWLNSFTYFASVGLQAENGSTGFVSPHDGSTRNYGAELRSIGSANVYGTKGAVADGSDCLMYLIQHNMAYIGTGKSKENDKTLRVEANEIEELNSGKIYFQTTDALGKFKVGNSFFADFDTGTTSIDADTVDFDSLSEIRITTGQDETFIDGTRIDTGNLLLSGNKISSSTGNLVIDAVTKTEIRSNVTMQGKLELSGDISIGQTLTKIGDEASDTVKFNMDFTQNIEPDIGGRYSLGSSSKRWREIFVSEANIDDIRIFDNQITTSVSNSDLEFAANGTGRIYIENNDVQIDNDLEVNGLLTIPQLALVGNITQTGNTDIQGNYYAITGNLTVENITIPRDVALKQFDIRGNKISGNVTNQDINLQASGTGRINVPNADVHIHNNLTVRDATTGALNITDDIDASAIDTGNIEVFTNVIQTTQSNSDLELRAAGTGDVILENIRFSDGDSTANEIYTLSGDLEFTPAENATITSTSALLLPIGNEAARRNTLGDIRYNNNKNLFEGYSTGVLTLGGVYSDDQFTFVNVNPTGNYIDFEVAGSNVATINSTQFEMPGLQADDVLIDGATITTTVSNSNLELRPNGTGTVVITGFTGDTTITNGIIDNTTNGALTISATDDGYTKVGGTFGVRIPTGDDSERGSSPQVGETRYNTEQEYLETWDGSLWQVSAGGGGETVSQDEMEQLILEYSLALG